MTREEFEAAMLLLGFEAFANSPLISTIYRRQIVGGHVVNMVVAWEAGGEELTAALRNAIRAIHGGSSND